MAHPQVTRTTWTIATIIIVAVTLWIGRRKLLSMIGLDTPLWPVPGHSRVSSPFGMRRHPITGEQRMHNGIDIAAPTGTPVVAPLDGKVIDVYNRGAGGKQLIILHENGLRTGYAHLDEWMVQAGEAVHRGQQIATVGNTGASTGPHLHFTVRRRVDLPHIDPLTWVKP